MTDSSLQHVAILDESARWLLGRQRNDTSQFGEDGLIQAVLERTGETNRWCFEVGAADGLFYSNTKRLRDDGWNAVLIEAEEMHAAKCRQFENDKVHVVNERIGSESLDAILARCGSPDQPDLGVLDIDGQDYWVWKRLKHRPRVMLVEYMYVNNNFTDPHFVPAEGGKGQAGLEAVIALGISKRYLPLASTYCNVLFVDEKAWK